jgi:2-octaprenyl-6-methoxyphenol hydroxylase
MKPQKYDVLIIGGGPVGSVAACALAQQGLKVALIDALNPQDILKSTYDGRTIAISYGSHEILKSIGIWDALATKAQAIVEIWVANAGRKEGFIRYGAEDARELAMGFNVEILHLRQALYKRCRELPSLTLWAPEEIKSFEVTEEAVKVVLKKGQKLQAVLCLAADGKNSTIRNQLKIPVKELKYNQTAIVCVVEHETPHQGRAFEYFHPNGPFAMLPMQGSSSSLIWTEKKTVAPSMLALSDKDFNEELHRRFGNTLGTLKVKGARWKFDLSATLVKSYVSTRVTLLGDSAHAIHPVAGQGLNLGLRDAALLSRHIHEAALLGLDIGRAEVLKSYGRQRYLDVLSMTAATDGLVRLFSNKNPLLDFLRGTGLTLVNKAPSLKRLFALHAMGKNLS